MTKKLSTRKARKERRRQRVRARIYGAPGQPRLNVFRSARHIFVQLIDDKKGATLVNVHSKNVKLNKEESAGGRKGKLALAFLTGKELAKKALAAKIKQVVFDRAGYRYHGRIKAVAEGAREGGLEF